MVDEKGLEAEAADRIGEWVQMSGGQELVEKLLGNEKSLFRPTGKISLVYLFTREQACGECKSKSWP